MVSGLTSISLDNYKLYMNQFPRFVPFVALQVALEEQLVFAR